MSEILWQDYVSLTTEPVDGKKAIDPKLLEKKYRLVVSGVDTFTVEALGWDAMGEISWTECHDDAVCVLVFGHGLQLLLLHRRNKQATATVAPAPTPVVEAAPAMAEPANVSTFPSDEHGPLF
jgi:hypothetical protein